MAQDFKKSLLLLQFRTMILRKVFLSLLGGGGQIILSKVLFVPYLWVLWCNSRNRRLK